MGWGGGGGGRGGGRFRGNSSFSLRPRMNSDFNAFSSISVSQPFQFQHFYNKIA